ncbi:pyridoxamine 5'-phosphate oxidase family protein [Oryzobacter sp. R7]|uniref:pyridoxamine 5'-phosphate oxidase family protein n=1 Tax=Oryzobacter faecalis TaxID=3388656 RepID=UPI00398D4EDC
MRLTPQEARARLLAADHGVLSTLHPERGVDAVPCAFAVDGDLLGFGVDRVKPKDSGRLRRNRNLEGDPRAALLVECWDRDDWTRLWWVRATLRHEPVPPEGAAGRLSRLLAGRYPQYVDEPFEEVVVLRVVGLTGWAASDEPFAAG